MFSRWQIRLLLIGTVLFGVGIGLLVAAIPNPDERNSALITVYGGRHRPRW